MLFIDREGIMKIGVEQITLLLLGALGIVACGDQIDKSIDDRPKNRDTALTFVNALNDDARFYLQPQVMIGDVFQEKYKAADLLKNDYRSYLYAWNKDHHKTTFGVRDNNSNNKQHKLDANLTDGGRTWVVAWMKGNDYQLSVFEKSPRNRSDTITLRVLASVDMDVAVDGNVLSRAKSGVVSAHISVEHCSGSLFLANHPIDLCQQDYGRSYLAVADQNGLRVVVEE
ncbi:hypothetical protein KJY73_20910 [Bowmanella sp. Y26]|uniref:hypothetical protein n=1 Tax=Bowmanella yangjiangensis TaxID=2811230 RepID=UPI001BDCEDC1|nr:hypothetical protein [Bowmanella yangjiangensis]MBT1066048.1 hypothetical protein [Bowmanella yangjiangensis]